MIVIFIFARGYTKSRIYNYERGANIASNCVCFDVFSIINKDRRKDNKSISVREYTKNRVYNYIRGANAINTNKRKEKIRIKV